MHHLTLGLEERMGLGPPLSESSGMSMESVVLSASKDSTGCGASLGAKSLLGLTASLLPCVIGLSLLNRLLSLSSDLCLKGGRGL